MPQALLERLAALQNGLLNVQPDSIAICEAALGELRKDFAVIPDERDAVLLQLARTRRLLEQANRYHWTWLEGASPVNSGYTAEGPSHSLPRCRLVSLQA